MKIFGEIINFDTGGRKPIKKTLKIIFSTVVLVAILSSSIYGQKLDNNLKLLEPLIKKRWEVKFEFSRLGTVTQQYEWEVIWDGKAIKYKINNEKVKFYSEAFFLGISPNNKLVCLV